MKSLLREHIRYQVRKMYEEREYELRQLSPAAFDALGQETLGIPPSAIVDVKIVKAPKPIFKCFLDNGQSFNLIDNGLYMQADINRILFDLDREDDVNGARYEMEKLMQQGRLKTDGEEDASTETDASDPFEPASEEPAEEPEA